MPRGTRATIAATQRWVADARPRSLFLHLIPALTSTTIQRITTPSSKSPTATSRDGTARAEKHYSAVSSTKGLKVREVRGFAAKSRRAGNQQGGTLHLTNDPPLASCPSRQRSRSIESRHRRHVVQSAPVRGGCKNRQHLLGMVSSAIAGSVSYED